MKNEKDFGRWWTIRWAEGVIRGFIQGNIELNRAKGMLQRAMKSGISKEEMNTLIEAIGKLPSYSKLLAKQKEPKLKLLKKAISL